MYKKVWYSVMVLMLGTAMSADATQLYRYINDNGVTVLDHIIVGRDGHATLKGMQLI